MELKEFITTTLTEIAQGVAEAKPIYVALNAEVNPVVYGATGARKENCNVDFEVALTDSSTSSKKGGVGVALSIVNIGGAKSLNTEITSLSKIKFSVPVKLPWF